MAAGDFRIAQAGRMVSLQAPAGTAIVYGTLVTLNSADRIQAATQDDDIIGMSVADIDADGYGSVMVTGAIRGPAESGQNLRPGQPIACGTAGQELTGADGGAIIGHVIRVDPSASDTDVQFWLNSSLNHAGTVPA